MTPEIDATSAPRRALLKGAAVAGLALPFLAACGSDGDSADSGGAPSSGGGASSSSGGGNTGGGNGGGQTEDVLATTSDVPVGGGVILDDDGIVITQPDSGDFKGFSNICTHMQCPVSNVSDGTINCLCHGSQYSIADGSVVAGPAPAPLPTKAITVKGKDILAG